MTDDGGAEMNANRAGLNISEPVWTHERVASSRSIQDALESLAIVSRYQRDAEIYPQQGGVECWYRVVRGAARHFSVCADGRRQIVDLLLPGDFFGFGVHGTHALHGRGNCRGHRHCALPDLADRDAHRLRASRRPGIIRDRPRGHIATSFFAFDPRPNHRGAEGRLVSATYARMRGK